MELTKTQTYQLLLNRNKIKKLNSRRFTTKVAWKCLHCLRPIYISFEQSTYQSIFCTPCWNRTSLIQTVAQAHYLKNLKTLQLRLFEHNKIIENKPITI